MDDLEKNAPMIVNLFGQEVLRKAHDEIGHCHANITRWKIEEMEFKVNTKIIQDYVKAYPICQQCRRSYQNSKLGDLCASQRGREVVSLD